MSRYQARHRVDVTPRPTLRKLALVAGVTSALGVPLAAAPASAQPQASGTLPSAVSMDVATTVVTRAAVTTLRVGSRGPRVASLQRFLRVTPDGIFGPITRRALLRFQRAQGLAQTGIVDPRTAAKVKRIAVSSPRRTVRVSRSSARTGMSAVMAEASSHAGKPYRYGANGPSSFDCSGFVQYVFGQVGISLPRTSGAQASAARSVAKSDRQPGDLIIMRSGGRVSHVGIYAGDNSMWVARRTGTTITRQTLWTSDYSVGRFA